MTMISHANDGQYFSRAQSGMIDKITERLSLYHTDNRPNNFFSRPFRIPSAQGTHQSISRKAKMLAALLIFSGIISRSLKEITELGSSVILCHNVNIMLSAPCGIRTHGLSLRRRTLYPAELKALIT